MTEDARRLPRRTFLGVAAAGALAACAPNPTGGGAGQAAGDAPASTPAATGDAGAATSAPAATTATPTPPTTPGAAAPTTAAASGAAAFVPNGPRDRRQVSLTFHANGDVGMATAILDTLAGRGVRVTIFGVGNWLAEQPALVRRMLADGHEVANHTWSHQPMGRLDRATLATEIERCAAVLADLTGSPSPWFRPSGIEVPTAAILEEAGRAGYATSVGYDCDSLDFQDPGAAAVVANVAATVQPGSIISVHFGHRNTVEAMPALLDLLAERDLRPVTVGELLA